MSELKEIGIRWEENGELHFSHVYLKSEADKVIAELKESVKSLILDNYLKDKETRHNKYKRCLAMARWCRTSSRWDESLGAFKYRDWYCKWFMRWMELAEKFKEAK